VLIVFVLCDIEICVVFQNQTISTVSRSLWFFPDTVHGKGQRDYRPLLGDANVKAKIEAETNGDIRKLVLPRGLGIVLWRSK
jgi:hypothetical protein